MAKKPDEKSAEIKAQALKDYRNNELTTEDIAARYGVSPATVTVWAKKAKMPLRERGRWKQEVPTARQAEIIKLCEVYTYQQVADKLGMFKQSVHRIASRWRAQNPPTKPPYVPGDQFAWKGKVMTVVSAKPLTGTVKDVTGKLYPNFVWGTGRIPPKIGAKPAQPARATEPEAPAAV